MITHFVVPVEAASNSFVQSCHGIAKKLLNPPINNAREISRIIDVMFGEKSRTENWHSVAKDAVIGPQYRKLVKLVLSYRDATEHPLTSLKPKYIMPTIASELNKKVHELAARPLKNWLPIPLDVDDIYVAEWVNKSRYLRIQHLAHAARKRSGESCV